MNGRFRDLQDSCRVKRRKVPDTVAEAMELADEYFKQVGESGTQEAKDAPLVMSFWMEVELLLLWATLQKAREEADSAKSKLDAFRATAKLATKEHNVGSEKVREERQDEVER